MTHPERLYPNLEFLFRITIQTDPARINLLESTPYGTCVDVAVAGGTVEGPQINGVVLNAGGDWGLRTLQSEKSLAVTDLDCTLLIQTNDEGNGTERLIQMSYSGVSYFHHNAAGSSDAVAGTIVDPDTYYFRTTPRFRTGSRKYDYLNRTVAVASGYHRHLAGPIYDIYSVL